MIGLSVCPKDRSYQDYNYNDKPGFRLDFVTLTNQTMTHTPVMLGFFFDMGAALLHCIRNKKAWYPEEVGDTRQ